MKKRQAVLFVCLAIMRDGNIPCNSQFNNWRVRWLLLYYIIFFLLLILYLSTINLRETSCLGPRFAFAFWQSRPRHFLKESSTKSVVAKPQWPGSAWFMLFDDDDDEKWKTKITLKFQCNRQEIVIVVQQVPNIFLVSVLLFVDISRWNSPAPSIIIIIIIAHG